MTPEFMMDGLILGMAFLVGLALGGFYFEVLWWTVQRLHDHPRPELLMLKSWALRMAVILPGFYLIMSGHWQRLAACLAGFLIMRGVVNRRVSKGMGQGKGKGSPLSPDPLSPSGERGPKARGGSAARLRRATDPPRAICPLPPGRGEEGWEMGGEPLPSPPPERARWRS